MRPCMADILLTFDGAAGTVRADGVRRPGRASFSMLDGWRSCPGRWLADRLLPRPTEWDSPLIVGSMAPPPLELAMREPTAAAPDWPALCRNGVALIGERNASRGWGDDPAPPVRMPDGRAATVEDWAGRAAARLSGFRLTDALGRVPEPMACEERVDGVVWGIPFTGSIDYVDGGAGGVTLVDWKTGRVPVRADAKARHADQLRVYALLWAHAHGFMPAGARDVYVEHRRSADADLSGGMIRGTGAWMRAAWDEVRAATGADGSGEYALRPSALCGWCPLARVCPNATIRGAKAREASRGAYDPDDPRFRVLGTHARHGVHDDGRMTMSLLSMLDSTPPAKPEPKVDVPDGVGVDPWATREGMEALAHWGVTPEDAPGVAPGDASATASTGTPASAPKDAPAATVTDVPASETSAPEPNPAETAAASAPKSAATGRTRLFEGRPYEGTWRDGALNAAGYGFGLMNQIAVRAMRLSRGHEAWERTVFDALLYAAWGIGRTVWADAAPDLPGLDAGRADPRRLFAWLDSTLCRDAWRALDAALDMDATVADAADAKELSRIIANAGRSAARALALPRAYHDPQGKGE